MLFEWEPAIHSPPTIWLSSEFDHLSKYRTLVLLWETKQRAVFLNRARSITHMDHLYTQTILTSGPSPHACRYCDDTLCGFQLHKSLSNIQVSLYCSQLYTMQTNRHTEDSAIQTGFDWTTAYIIRLPGKSTAESMRQRQPSSYQ